MPEYPKSLTQDDILSGDWTVLQPGSSVPYIYKLNMRIQHIDYLCSSLGIKYETYNPVFFLDDDSVVQTLTVVLVGLDELGRPVFIDTEEMDLAPDQQTLYRHDVSLTNEPQAAIGLANDALFAASEAALHSVEALTDQLEFVLHTNN